MSKKLKDKQQRRLAEEARKAQARKQHQRANLITIAIAAVVAIAVAVGVVLAQNAEENPSVGVAAGEAGCGERTTFASEGNQHVDTGTPVQYEHNPPTTGNHWPPEALLPSAGFYTDPQDAERLVHHQEHGQIVVYYNPDAPQEVKDQLDDLVSQSPAVNFAVPWPDIEEPYNFTLTAWQGDGNEGVQQSCELPSQEMYDEWRRDFQGRGPEQIPTIPVFTGN